MDCPGWFHSPWSFSFWARPCARSASARQFWGVRHTAASELLQELCTISFFDPLEKSNPKINVVGLLPIRISKTTNEEGSWSRRLPWFCYNSLLCLSPHPLKSSFKTNAVGFPQWPYCFGIENGQSKVQTGFKRLSLERRELTHLAREALWVQTQPWRSDNTASNGEKAHHMLC